MFSIFLKGSYKLTVLTVYKDASLQTHSNHQNRQHFFIIGDNLRPMTAQIVGVLDQSTNPFKPSMLLHVFEFSKFGLDKQ